MDFFYYDGVLWQHTREDEPKTLYKSNVFSFSVCVWMRMTCLLWSVYLLRKMVSFYLFHLWGISCFGHYIHEIPSWIPSWHHGLDSLRHFWWVAHQQWMNNLKWNNQFIVISLLIFHSHVSCVNVSGLFVGN